MVRLFIGQLVNKMMLLLGQLVEYIDAPHYVWRLSSRATLELSLAHYISDVGFSLDRIAAQSFCYKYEYS